MRSKHASCVADGLLAGARQEQVPTNAMVGQSELLRWSAELTTHAAAQGFEGRTGAVASRAAGRKDAGSTIRCNREGRPAPDPCQGQFAFAFQEAVRPNAAGRTTLRREFGEIADL